MSKPNLATMTRPEFTCGTLRERQYILEHKEDDEAVSIYLERFTDPNAKIYPATKGLNDPEVEAALRERLEQRPKEA